MGTLALHAELRRLLVRIVAFCPRKLISLRVWFDLSLRCRSNKQTVKSGSLTEGVMNQRLDSEAVLEPIEPAGEGPRVKVAAIFLWLVRTFPTLLVLLA